MDTAAPIYGIKAGGIFVFNIAAINGKMNKKLSLKRYKRGQFRGKAANQYIL
jgi:hypothetical protein